MIRRVNPAAFGLAAAAVLCLGLTTSHAGSGTKSGTGSTSRGAQSAEAFAQSLIKEFDKDNDQKLDVKELAVAMTKTKERMAKSSRARASR